MYIREPILLIGPMGIGKTTISNAMSTVFNIPVYNFDKSKWKHFKSYGFSKIEANLILNKYGLKSMYEYYKLFEYDMLINVLGNPQPMIYDIGAGFLYFERKNKIIFIKNLLNNFSKIYLLYPTPNIQKSYNFLYQRIKVRMKDDPGLSEYLFDDDFNLISIFNKFYYPSKFYINNVVPIFTKNKKISTIVQKIISS